MLSEVSKVIKNVKDTIETKVNNTAVLSTFPPENYRIIL